MAEEEDVFPDTGGGIDDFLGALEGEVPTHYGVLDANAATDGRPDVGDDGVSPGLGHFHGFFRGADIDDGKEVHFPGERDHFVFFLHAHAGLFEHAPEMAVDDGMGGKVVHAAETHLLDLAQPVPHAAAGIGGVDAADDGYFFDDRQHFVLTDLHGDGIGIAVGHHAAGGAMTHHAEAAGVVDDDEVGAALLDEFGADARASAGGDHGVAFLDGVHQALADFFAGVGISFAGPGIGHGLETKAGWN